MNNYTSKYNTPLPQGQEELYQAWLKAFPTEQQNTYDYDMQGAYLDGVQAEGGHLTDRYKKPNHPTFSKGSKYSNNENVGGEWVQTANGKWLFYPSQTNMREWSGDELRGYFRENEPNATLMYDLKDIMASMPEYFK